MAALRLWNQIPPHVLGVPALFSPWLCFCSRTKALSAAVPSAGRASYWIPLYSHWLRKGVRPLTFVKCFEIHKLQFEYFDYFYFFFPVVLGKWRLWRAEFYPQAPEFRDAHRLQRQSQIRPFSEAGLTPGSESPWIMDGNGIWNLTWKSAFAQKQSPVEILAWKIELNLWFICFDNTLFPTIQECLSHWSLFKLI